MLRLRYSICLAVCLSMLASALAGERGADEPKTPAATYGEGVRPTPHLSPEEEKAGFHLPTGFVAELVASEPQISKPLNMAFDARGRLWITDTIEYPYPAPAGQVPRDSIKVLEDKDQNGSFETVTTFADGLNIPIGILPIEEGVIAFSIPNLMLLKDKDGDGKCDERQVLLGPFDTTRDTHGMINALRRGQDGWIYACHGFNNQSHVKAADGSEIHLISGNTFRFRPDGSHVEQFTTGQVNPFGMTSDEFGNWYTADCHSKPVTMLVPGGYYESFGRPHDGLGFVPAVMDHLHGSTAICGISYYMADQYPAEFRRKFYSGNVMTSRINCNRFEMDRDRIRLVEEPDFMTSEDPWFRPVDIILGADGALYVADFYNKIIGHYEVRLDHPERDRNSGRIWRIVYRGDKESRPLGHSQVEGPKVPSPEHLAQLASPNATTRQFAFDALVKANLPQQQLQRLSNSQDPYHQIAALWALHRSGRDSLATLAAKSQSPNAEVVVAALKIWTDLPREAGKDTTLLASARAALASDQPHVAIAAANALAQHGGVAEVSALLEQVAKRPGDAAIVPHAMRIAVKRILQTQSIAAEAYAAAKRLPEDQSTAFAAILPAVNTPEAAGAMLELVIQGKDKLANLRGPALQLACKHMKPEFAAQVLQLIQGLPSAADTTDSLLEAGLDQQTSFGLEALATLRQDHQAVPKPLIDLINGKLIKVTNAIAAQLVDAGAARPVDWQGTGGRKWSSEERKRADNGQTAKVVSSLPLGEAYVGTYATAVFPCPDKLTFWLCGHDGPPNVPSPGKNLVRLVLADSGKPIAQAAPPRSDLLSQVDWQLKEYAGQSVRLECVDGDDGNAYAWLAVEGFSLATLNPPRAEAAIVKLGKLIEGTGADGLAVIKSPLEQILKAPALTNEGRARLTSSVNAARGNGLGKLLADTAVQRGQAAAVSPALALGTGSEFNQACKEVGTEIASRLTLPQQTIMARGLIGSSEGRQLLLQLVDEGRVSPQSLRTIKEVLSASPDDADAARLIQLSEAASAAPSQAEQAIVDRVAAFKAVAGDFDKGKLIYEKNCANCHKLRGAGQLVGPQLDGAAARGPDRLAEDILLPNRNVDKAFRMTSLLMDDDRVIVGLVRETAAGDLELVGTDGKTQMIDKSQIATRKDTTRSLMPDNFAELINDQDLSHLLQFITQH